MPPPIIDDPSDDESTGGSIPFNDSAQAVENDDAVDEDGGDNDEEMYDVEKILEHQFVAGGQIVFRVKWKGYEKEEEQTWEPEENLETAEEALNDYFESIGGRPQPPQAQRGRGKRKSMTKDATPVKTAEEPVKRRRKSKGVTEPVEDIKTETSDETEEVGDWVPKGKSWEHEVVSVDTIIRDPDTKSLYAYLFWKNGKRSKVSIQTCYAKCPLQV
ncbi:hypothetical protein ASPZODRAFT_144113 [Penicilliopsis zonata CBS 506.65]|uniref:Chromo domain-containing protein n=1 Tax=Penicilliopsis zonata CBS 506.65 TaxID=1073090 RepID=A0A1L9SEL2_9EURO|nr:hypothetical protein ASPZODRAFT_144113 [Penicilliopsis zonata CBS 506.65]OJJ45484.1 hypothetical protein ASPZODRAFT_144113 [Penicilliopsis zonata CBS 506.65]